MTLPRPSELHLLPRYCIQSTVGRQGLSKQGPGAAVANVVCP